VRSDPILYRIIRYLSIWILKLIYRVEVINKKNIPKKGPIIVVSNHKHNFDPGIFMMSTRRTIYILTKDKLHKGKFAFFFRWIGTIPVNRNIHDENAKNMAIEALNNGKAIGIFPEGTHNKTKDIIMPFKYGAVSFAKKTGALIIPCAITGKYKAFKKGVRYEIGEPFSVDNMELVEANKLLESKVIELLKKGQKHN